MFPAPLIYMSTVSDFHFLKITVSTSKYQFLVKQNCCQEH